MVFPIFRSKMGELESWHIRLHKVVIGLPEFE